MTRVVPALVSLMGSLGLGLAFGYLVMVFRAFQPGGDAIVDFLIGSSDEELNVGFLLMVVPYALLMGHLWLRVRLGPWLLKRGEEEAARRYAEKRLRPGLLRARKEALAHRTVLVRIALRNCDYTRAGELCEAAKKLPGGGEFLIDFRRWELEAALRRENLVDAHRIVDELGVPNSDSRVAAAFCAAAAEICVREGDERGCEEWLERAEWAFDDEVRARLTRGLAAAEFGRTPDDWRHGADALRRVEAYLDDVPGAAGEVLATRGRLARLLGEEEEADALLRRANECPADRRSEYVIARVGQSAALEEE